MIYERHEMTVFDPPVQTIVNPVNCDGVMGRGLALEIKTRFPEVFAKYEAECKRGRMKIGKLQLVKTDPRWVLNFPTKDHWRGKSKLTYIEQGLRKFKATYVRLGITSAAFPALGCGNGGLDWEIVSPLMHSYLENLKHVEIFICLGRPMRIDAIR
jgi:O-acetyl-ADP-ribose deacetylase (regulator of RNase III)